MTKNKLNLFLWGTEFTEFVFVDTTPLVDEYFTDPKDHTYDWKGVLPRQEYISNLLKVTLIILPTDHFHMVITT